MKYGNLLYLTFLLLLACSSHKNTAEQTAALADQFVHDAFTMTGDYHWSFQLMGTTQHSVHEFHPDYIDYEMEGKVYSTKYRMTKLSYEQDKQKWIGEDEEGNVYVMFFKEDTDSSLTIYKRKCKSEGLAEALAFDFPAADATEDHGWNIYTSSEKDQADVLPLSGMYAHEGAQISITDSLIVFDGKAFNRLSYHAGERRWVGQSDSTYLQVFFADFENADQLGLSVVLFDDLEVAYRKKYKEGAFLAYQKQ